MAILRVIIVKVDVQYHRLQLIKLQILLKLMGYFQELLAMDNRYILDIR